MQENDWYNLSYTGGGDRRNAIWNQSRQKYETLYEKIVKFCITSARLWVQIPVPQKRDWLKGHPDQTCKDIWK
jgi:hypothetical protein